MHLKKPSNWAFQRCGQWKSSVQSDPREGKQIKNKICYKYSCPFIISEYYLHDILSLAMSVQINFNMLCCRSQCQNRSFNYTELHDFHLWVTQPSATHFIYRLWSLYELLTAIMTTWTGTRWKKNNNRKWISLLDNSFPSLQYILIH